MARSSQAIKDILKEARERFKRCQDWEATARARWKDDLRFSEGDAYNNWQWPQSELNRRAQRPCLTINRVRQHNLDILNDARQSRVSVKVRPLRDGASFESANTLDGLIKHIEYISNAESAYQMALSFAVRAGIGYVRLALDYIADDSFDQEIFIRSVKDPLSIYLDPDIREFDGSDAMFGFVFTDMPKEAFDRAYPRFKDTAGDNELAPDDSWAPAQGETRRVAEYFRCVPNEDKLIGYTDPETGQQATVRQSEASKALLAKIIDDPQTTQRSVVMTKVEHFKIIGDQIAEEKLWPGRYVPILRCIGEETVIEGQLDRKGHTRALLDQQRMANYNASASVEFGALQTKVPWLAPVKAMEELQQYWENANTENYAFLPYNHVDDDGNPIPSPTRPAPPSGSPVFMQGFRDAIEQMYLASGQNQADFGQPGNERSGVAIENRQREGDKATYHYLSHQADMIRFLGKQLIDLISKVYDTERIVKWRDEAGNEGNVKIDPEAPEHFQQQQDEDGNINAILNPKLGVYDVQADVGPAYATRRQEAFAAFSQLLGANKELFALVGDIWMRFADIPGGNEAAERLKRMVPQQALKDGPPPDVMALQGQLEQAKAFISDLTAKLADKSGKEKIEIEKNVIGAHKAVTERVSAIKEALALDPDGLKLLVREVIEEAQAQSAGGNAIDHVMEETPQADAIHPGLGGQLQPPAPHPPPVDSNKAVPY